jgi:hypothetical protein
MANSRLHLPLLRLEREQQPHHPLENSRLAQLFRPHLLQQLLVIPEM